MVALAKHREEAVFQYAAQCLKGRLLLLGETHGVEPSEFHLARVALHVNVKHAPDEPFGRREVQPPQPTRLAAGQPGQRGYVSLHELAGLVLGHVAHQAEFEQGRVAEATVEKRLQIGVAHTVVEGQVVSGIVRRHRIEQCLYRVLRGCHAGGDTRVVNVFGARHVLVKHVSVEPLVGEHEVQVAEKVVGMCHGRIATDAIALVGKRYAEVEILVLDPLIELVAVVPVHAALHDQGLHGRVRGYVVGVDGGSPSCGGPREEQPSGAIGHSLVVNGGTVAEPPLLGVKLGYLLGARYFSGGGVARQYIGWRRLVHRAAQACRRGVGDGVGHLLGRHVHLVCRARVGHESEVASIHPRAHPRVHVLGLKLHEMFHGRGYLLPERYDRVTIKKVSPEEVHEIVRRAKACVVGKHLLHAFVHIRASGVKLLVLETIDAQILAHVGQLSQRRELLPLVRHHVPSQLRVSARQRRQAHRCGDKPLLAGIAQRGETARGQTVEYLGEQMLVHGASLGLQALVRLALVQTERRRHIVGVYETSVPHVSVVGDKASVGVPRNFLGRQLAEQFLHVFFHGGGVYIANDGDILQRRSVPSVVKTPHVLGLERAQPLLPTDHVATRVSRVVVDGGRYEVAHAMVHVVALSPLFHDDGAFLVHVLWRYAHAVAPVV